MRFSLTLPTRKILCRLALGLAAGLVVSDRTARADEIRNPTAIFAGLDKITGRIISFDVAIDETVQFGTLQITPRVCLTRPQTEAPLTEGFVEVDEIENAKNARRVFSGWMFSASPGLHGVEHPVYDVWLKDCKGGKDVVASPAPGAGANAPPPANAQAAPPPERKPRRTITPQEPEEPKVEALPPSADPGPVPPAEPPESPIGAKAPDEPAQAPGAEPAPLPPPVEIGAPPGAGGPNANPAAPPKPPKKAKKPKKPKSPSPSPPPQDGVERQPLQPQAPEQPPRQRDQGFPNILPRNLF
jgi:hypothetical protein